MAISLLTHAAPNDKQVSSLVSTNHACHAEQSHAMQTQLDQQRRNRRMEEVKQKALDLRDKIRKDSDVMVQTATVPDRYFYSQCIMVHCNNRVLYLSAWHL